MTVLHQALPTLHRRDAVGTHALHIQALLREQGIESEIYVGQTDLETADLSRPIGELGDGPVLYHYAVTSVVVDTLLGRNGPIGIDSHNATPSHHFARWDPWLVAATATSGRDLERLRPRVTAALADSTFNAAELARLGYPSCAVAPVLFDVDRAGTRGDGVGADVDLHQWLFVGRLVPNKAQHDLVLALAAARRHVDPQASLVLAGSTASPPYLAALLALIDRLGLTAAVTITGPIDDASLDELYRRSGVFVSASEHEGFGVPFIEAMARGLPVVAFESTAVGETVGSGGVLLASKRPLDIALAVWDAGRPGRRDQLVAAARSRAQRFALSRTRPEMWDALQPLLS